MRDRSTACHGSYWAYSWPCRQFLFALVMFRLEEMFARIRINKCILHEQIQHILWIEVRSYYVQGIDSTNSKTGDVFYGVEVKDEQDWSTQLVRPWLLLMYLLSGSRCDRGTEKLRVEKKYAKWILQSGSQLNFIVELLDESWCQPGQDNNAFKYGARWTDSPCVSEQFKGTWTAGGHAWLTCAITYAYLVYRCNSMIRTCTCTQSS